MKLEITKQEFMKSWQIAERTVNPRSTITSLTGILCRPATVETAVLLEATDLKTSVTCVVEGVRVIEEGETYELRIESVGNKGDGIAKVDKYLIFVPSAIKGEIVRAKIKKISGTLAFAEVVERKGKVS